MIRVYGDSYVAGWHPFKSWIDVLADMRNTAVMSRAVSGGSSENAFKSLFKDSNCACPFQDGDVIVFAMSTIGRLHFKFQDSRPETASLYLHDLGRLEDPKNHIWYIENRDYIEWWMVNMDHEVLSANCEGYIAYVKELAVNYPRCTFVLLENSMRYLDPNYNPQSLLHRNPENFLRPNIFLDHIARGEFVNPNMPYYEWTKYTGYDTRVNHLSKPNLNTLATLVNEAINTKTTEHITMDKFKSRFLEQIKTTDDYQRYIDLGYLENNSFFFSVLRGELK